MLTLHLSRVVVAGAVPLLMLTAVTAARASCGDYALHGSGTAAAHSIAFDEPTGQVLPWQEHSRPAQCHGPHCGRHMTPPPAAPDEQRPQPSDDLADSASLSGQQWPSLAGVFAEPGHVSQGIPADVERPPRG